MNQKLEHGMKVRAKHDVRSVQSGQLLWYKDQEYAVTVTVTGVVIIGALSATHEGHDYTDLFTIIPDPMTAEEAMAAIVEWERNTNSATRLIEIIDEYKKGRE